MSHITLAAAPTFPQPNFHDSQNQGNPPPYTEYDQQLRYLASPQVPVNDSGFWENTRDNAVHMLNEQASGSYVVVFPNRPSRI